MSSQNYALITGASSGIGATYAASLARRGYNLILVARNEARLKEVAAKIQAESNVKVELLAADLEDPASRRKVEEVLATDDRITMLVNNAGVGSAAPLLQSNVEKMEQMIELNVNSLMRLTYAAVPRFVAEGSGTIINISSIVAISPEALNGVYGGSKAFVLAFTQSLQHELKDKGVRVQAVLPGATATDFWDRAGLPVAHLPQEIVMQASDLVDAALAGLDQGEAITIPSLPELKEWEAYESARRAMAGRLSATKPAARYGAR